MLKYCFARDKIILTENATLHPMDLAVIRGYGIFDFFRVSNSKPLFLDHYLDRFINSAEATYLGLALSREELSQVILELIDKNDMITGGFRMILTGGLSENHFSPGKGSLFIFAEELFLPSEEKYSKGIKLLGLEHVRPLAKIKTTNYAYPVWHSKIWKEAGAEDVLYHQDGMISESSRSNFYIIKDGKLITPSKQILEGITRHHILELADMKEIRDLGMEEALQADEAFITSTTKVLLPVVQIDNHKIGTGKPGPISLDLLRKFRNLENELVS
ncbi:aminotransferase class IV [Algoriphagus sediminis]|uniref:branched-chain-amino-acid transaminase n=1 Tax=Algoriphagus sediminis TaxID=3057113 RepID=A0ABT7YG78_9BACT|nr:aminotransferase class IV [Algoriphagus sediminis]MDN3205536.1 aminotransferase class IV [Algoriphagus sediminis]